MLGKRPVVLLAVAFLACLAALSALSDLRPASAQDQKAPEAKAPATQPAQAPRPSPRAAPTTRPSAGKTRSRQLSAAQESRTLAFLKDHRPTSYRRFIELKKDDPRRYHRAMRKMYGFMKRWQQMPEAMRQATETERELQINIVGVVRRIRQTGRAAEKATLEEELKQAISDHFDAEQELRERRLQHMDDQIKQLRQELSEQREQREQIIKERMERWMRATKPVGRSTRPAGK